MARFLLSLTVLSVAVVLVRAWPSGAPKSVCKIFQPVGHMREENSIADQNIFSIKSGCYVVFPNDEMFIWIDAANGTIAKGLALKVVNSDGKTVGEFSLAGKTNFKYLKCRGPRDKTVVTHANRKPKDIKSFRFSWKAPSSCVKGEVYTIRAIVVQQKNAAGNAYQTDIVRTMVCDPDYSNAKMMEPGRPPSPRLYCAVGTPGQWAVIPSTASTSFEQPQPPNGWKHFYFSSKIAFRRHTGETTSPGTGPLAAQDGEYYMYYEGTGADYRGSAGLYSPYGLSGCFCLSFWCHMNTDGVTIFTVSAIGPDSKTLLKTAAVTTEWDNVKMTVVTGYPIIIAVQVFRGNSAFADVALDNITVTKGECDKFSPVHFLG